MISISIVLLAFIIWIEGVSWPVAGGGVVGAEVANAITILWLTDSWVVAMAVRSVPPPLSEQVANSPSDRNPGSGVGGFVVGQCHTISRLLSLMFLCSITRSVCRRSSSMVDFNDQGSKIFLSKPARVGKDITEGTCIECRGGKWYQRAPFRTQLATK